MKTSLKWILGIGLVLVVAAGLFFLPLFLQNSFGMGFGPRMMGSDGPMLRGFDNWHRPMMGRGGFMPFGMPLGGFMFLGGLMRLVPLALLALVIYGAYRLGKNTNAPVTAPAPSAPAPVSAPEMGTCSHCGSAVQTDWKHCPQCGAAL